MIGSSPFQKKTLLLSFAFIYLLAAAHATITLPSFFGNDMVLQQQTDAPIWGWAKANSTVQITTTWNKKKYTTAAGADGKWKIKLPTPAAGGPYEITFSDGTALTLKNVLIGEVWLCSGQSNMEMPMKGYRDQPILASNDAVFNAANTQIRLYTVPRAVKVIPQDSTRNASWKVAAPEAVSNFSAVAYHFGKIMEQQLKVPIGLIVISYGGSSAEAWMSPDALKAFPELTLPTLADTAKVNNRTPTTLYHGMLQPFIGYAIKGCLWYQGESNNGRAPQYEKLFPAMVKQWRQEFAQGDFPFFFAQIAPYNYRNGTTAVAPLDLNSNSAFLRDAQRKAVNAIPNSGMVVLMDNGEEFNIHPADKPTVGKRFSYMALASTYGFKGFAYQSPAFDSLLISGTIATLKFKHAPNGLTSYGKALTQFEIAGADKIFRPAAAHIRNGTIVVSSPLVPVPVAVRYAFKDFIMGELFSTEGYPLSSFRTDDW
jgi:sialate O-acetylesterase